MAESYTSPTMATGAAVDAALANGNAAQQAHVDQRIFGFIPAGPIPTLSWNESTWTLTLIQAGSWSYYRNSIKYPVSGNKSVTLPYTPAVVDPPAAEIPPTAGMWWIRIASNDGTLSASQTPWTLGPTDSDVPVCSIEVGATLTPKSLGPYTELHPADMNRGTHRYEHITTGPKLVSGGVVDPTSYTIQGNSTASNTFSISEAYYMDETLGVTVPALVDDNGATTKYLIRNRLSGAFTWTQSLVPYRYVTNGYIQWDNNGTITEAGSSAYINTFLLATQAGWQLITGQASHSSSTLALAENFQNLSLTGLQLADYIVVYRLTWRTGSAYAALGKCRLETVTKVSVSSITVGTSTGLPAPHASTHGASGSDPLTGYAASSFILSNALGAIDDSASQKAIPSGVVVGTTDTQTLSAKTITGLKETKTTSSSYNFDLSAGNYFTHTASANNLTVSNVPTTGTVGSFIIELTNGGAFTFSFWSGIKWAGGSVPTLTASGVDILGFYTHDGGTTWRGLLLAKDSR